MVKNFKPQYTAKIVAFTGKSGDKIPTSSSESHGIHGRLAVLAVTAHWGKNKKIHDHSFLAVLRNSQIVKQVDLLK